MDENIGKIVTPSADRKHTAAEILEVRCAVLRCICPGFKCLRNSEHAILMGNQINKRRISPIQEAEAAATAATAAAAAAPPKDAKSARQVKAAAKRAARAAAQAGKSLVSILPHTKKCLNSHVRIAHRSHQGIDDAQACAEAGARKAPKAGSTAPSSPHTPPAHSPKAVTISTPPTNEAPPALKVT